MIEDENFDSIDEALEVSSEIIKKEPIAKPTKTSPKHLKSDEEDVEKDYKYSRAQLYSLVEKGQEAVDGALDVAQQSDSARAYEVAGQLIKHVADTADKLIDLQKKMKEIDEVKEKNTTNVTNNSLFVGSTADLQKMLKQMKKDTK
ncbi:terminase small subunit [Cyanophage S-SSM6a]|uniref:Terminase DNA packaging enzyme small subunit n=1 Tax=Synechococcus phage S-SSM7 TaxID=445686 RepID=E3SL56_9CAUD|nr:terminase small subunit [Synechococcus phage S-SSM7]ADO98204.1 terminase DNA packaging enzyme small subunit [Synechococcus phage S-SSM7]AGH07451.1 terminase small subunit [Cyanophage S-SSM6a]|tara:strand:+ start:216 stop:653 length:438 start_codon:yes stop_codon:yes gene_type:complete